MFEFLKSKRRKEEDRGCEAYQLALNFMSAIELAEPLFGPPPTDDKGELAYNLFLYGALDAACKLKQVPDDLFLALVRQFFTCRGKTPLYSYPLVGLSQDQGASNAAFMAIVEGGNIFIEWMKGKALAPASVIVKLEKYTDDPAFPATRGHLIVTLMERRPKVA